MLSEIILTIILLIALVIASIQDIKKREVEDYLPYTLIILSIIFLIINSIKNHTLTNWIIPLITFGVFIIVALLLYHSRQWGGGDAKMLMALGISLPAYPQFLTSIFNPNLNLPFPLILFINICLCGAIYGILYFTFLTLKHKIKIKIKNSIKLLSITASCILLILTILAPRIIKLPLLLLTLLTFLYPYITKMSKQVQKQILTQTIPISKLTEGDWLAKSIIKNKKTLISKNTTGITQEDINKIKKAKIKKVVVKYGIPFIPSFLLGVLLSLILGNLFLI